MQSTSTSPQQITFEDRQPWLAPVYLCGAMFLAYVARQSLFSIFPILRSQLSFSEVQLGLTGTVFLWTYALANPFTGYLGDRFSKKKLIIASVILWSGCTGRKPRKTQDNNSSFVHSFYGMSVI